MNLTAILGNVSMFRGLEESSLAALAREARSVDVRKGARLFADGEPGRALFLLLDGGIQLLKTSESGQDVVVKTVSPGELFGEVVLFERDRYPVTAVAVATSRLVRIPVESLHKLLEDGRFRSDFLRVMMGRLRYLAERILYLTAYDVETRLRLFLEQHYGQREEYRLTLSNKALAAAIGTTPETLSRLKERLVSSRALEWEGRVIRMGNGKPRQRAGKR